jgi:serine/threonine-protein kinase
MVPVCIALALCSYAVVILGFSPSLNPLDVLAGSGFRTQVVDLVGLTQTKAYVTLEDHHLEGSTRFAASLTVPPGRVISQKPSPGDTVRRGHTVTLVVSRGKAQVDTPDVVGMEEDEATEAIEAVGLNHRAESKNDETVPKGAVISQSPIAGEVVVGGSQVSLVVSMGPAPRTVPDVAKLPIEGALYRLGRAGFTLGKLTSIDDPQLPANAVISTSPGKGEVRDRDTPVDVVVSNGPTAVSLPSLVGKTIEEATATVTRLGLIPAQKTTTVAPDDPSAGKVSGQSPASGTPIRPGEVVTLDVKRAG